jgi:CheY-like chemotaxis protein
MTDYSMPGMTGYELLKKIKVSFVDDSIVFTKLKWSSDLTKKNLKKNEVLI